MDTADADTEEFDELVAEGASVPVEGWDFSWFDDGRATEQRPSWAYARLIGERLATVASALDIDTGGGEVLASIPRPPALLVATESWPPNARIAADRLRPLRGTVVATADERVLPFRDNTFELVVSRHPVATWWPEIARVLRPGGSYLSQQIGAGQQLELIEAMMGPHTPSAVRATETAVAAARAAGLTVVDLRHETPRTVFYDIAAVVYFLRKVLWTVPDFTVERYRDQLLALHRRIKAEGSFTSRAPRFLIEARKIEAVEPTGAVA
ncbi:MAG TPA: class I SAM-dependent methyltransferase [Pseudonocardiaceae bacterium]|jgi:SAM-dependent methyltransferase|nr:class I SAM-dependent methyltransferase [Pseudonocardiaceae bacterium]